MGIGGVAFCAVVLMLILSLVENNLTRRGRYSGAGAAIACRRRPRGIQPPNSGFGARRSAR
jgi:hypothetical protein